MSSGLHLLAAVGILFAVCLGQDLNPSACVGSITSFPNCDNVNAILQRCNQLTAKQDIINCFCTQDLINAYVGCEEEFRQCALSTTYDSEFEDSLSQWHSACDDKISFAVTTSSIALPTQTLDQDTCPSIDQSCIALQSTSSSCLTAYTAASDLSSCQCQPSVLSLASVCEIDGSLSCLFQTPISTSLWSYVYCQGAVTGNNGNPSSPTGMTITQGHSTTTGSIQTIGNTPQFGGPSSTPASKSHGSKMAAPKYLSFLGTLAWLVANRPL
ncbi:hypothetical protein F5883DRAFT_509362 [Diaporthe sp. PMI_573]|nr:hypothetical protein F5883DRAFT_509362 [Diaporthaceae sp. PMI_573]